MASEMGAQFVIGCDAHAPEAVMQPQDADGFTAFLERNNISAGDNIIELAKL